MARELLTKKYAKVVVDTLMERHRMPLGEERFDVAARVEGEMVIVKLTLRNQDKTFVYEMEAAVTLRDESDMSEGDAMHLALDFLDWYLGEYFGSQRELLLPLDWQPHRFGDQQLLARGDIRNEVLDDLADRWLRGERPEVPRHLRKAPTRH